MGQELQQEDDHHHHNAKPTNFFPMFCRMSLKDIKPQNPIIIATATKPFSGEPGSPRVTCTGQVRRSCRVTGFPPAAATVTGHHRHRKPISNKSLLPNPALVGGARTCRSTKEMCQNNNNYYYNKRVKSPAAAKETAINWVVDIGEMDPPMPVRPPPPPPEVNLWRRRRRNGCGVGIEKLEIGEIKVENYCRFGFRSPAPATAG